MTTEQQTAVTLLHELRKREVQAIGAAISTQSWHGVEVAYNQLRDKMDAAGAWHEPRLASQAEQSACPVQFATVRDGGDEWHIECRFKDGQKFAAVTVDKDQEALADWIALSLSQPPEASEGTLREAAASIADGQRMSGNDQWSAGYDAAARKIARAIRSLPLS